MAGAGGIRVLTGQAREPDFEFSLPQKATYRSQAPLTSALWDVETGKITRLLATSQPEKQQALGLVKDHVLRE